MRCVVFGAGGFIGTNLCRRLSGRVAELRGFGRHPPSDGLAGLKWVSGDFADAVSVARALDGCDTVFHLITCTTPASANANKVADIVDNVLPTINLLDACQKAGVAKVVFVSSGGTVYGRFATVPTTEDEATWPDTAYGISKLAIERYLHLYHYLHAIDYCVLRVSNPFGPFQEAGKNQGVIAAFLKRALAGLPVEIWGDGSVCRDYLYIDDVTEALELAALYRGEQRIFNIGSGVSRSLSEVVAGLEAALGTVVEVHYREGRLVDVPVSLLNVERARAYLGWSPGTSFEDGINHTVRWWGDHAERRSER